MSEPRIDWPKKGGLYLAGPWGRQHVIVVSHIYRDRGGSHPLRFCFILYRFTPSRNEDGFFIPSKVRYKRYDDQLMIPPVFRGWTYLGMARKEGEE